MTVPEALCERDGFVGPMRMCRWRLSAALVVAEVPVDEAGEALSGVDDGAVARVDKNI
ncbi:MAG: hypothetical protein RXO24_06365 [Acidilobus sp.]